MIEIDFKNITKKVLDQNCKEIIDNTNKVNDFISKKKKKNF